MNKTVELIQKLVTQKTIFETLTLAELHEAKVQLSWLRSVALENNQKMQGCYYEAAYEVVSKLIKTTK